MRYRKKEVAQKVNMMSRPVPAPRTHAGKQVAKCTLEKVSIMPEGTSASTQKSISPVDSSSEKMMVNKDMTGQRGLTRPAGATDLNLTNLISEVERDIWLLEQLENNSSTKRALQNPLELPFPVTEEILSLPGYKPGRNKSIGEGMLIYIPKLSFVSIFYSQSQFFSKLHFQCS